MEIPEYNKELLQHYFTNGIFEIRMVPTGTIGKAYVNIKEKEITTYEKLNEISVNFR